MKGFSMTIKNYKIQRIQGTSKKLVTDPVIVEAPFHLYVNANRVFTFLCSPENLEHLVLGYLFSQGYIKKMDDVLQLFIDEINRIAEVELDSLNFQKYQDQAKREADFDLPSYPYYHSRDERLVKSQGDRVFQISSQAVFDRMEDFNQMSQIFKETGAAHSAALCDEENIIYFVEDVARNNCMDKIVGYCLKNQVDLTDKFLLISCRISSEIILKAAKIGFPTLGSISACTDLAIEIAQENKMVLLGFIRGKRMNVYTEFDGIS